MKFHFTSFILALTFATQTISTFVESNQNHLDCPICYESIIPAEYFQSFDCAHTHIHQKCAQNRIDSLVTEPNCPICYAPTLLTPTPSRRCVFGSSDSNICIDPETISIFRERVRRSIIINDYEHLFSDLLLCKFPKEDILKFILFSMEESKWISVIELLGQKNHFEFHELKPLYKRVLKLQTIHYESLMSSILTSTSITSLDILINEHKSCILKRNVRCVNMFLNWYHNNGIYIHRSNELYLFLENYITRYPLSMTDSTILVLLPRNLISSDLVGRVVRAQCHKFFHSIDYHQTFRSVVHNKLVIPEEYMRDILHHTISHWSKNELDMVLKYRFFSEADIQSEFQFLNSRWIPNRYVSFLRNETLILQKLDNYLTNVLN